MRSPARRRLMINRVRVPSRARALEQPVGATAAKANIDIFGTPAMTNEIGCLNEIRDASDRTFAGSTARDIREMSEEIFTLPTSPAGPWDRLTRNEQTWIEFIRVISCGSDPKSTSARVRALRELLDVGRGGG